MISSGELQLRLLRGEGLRPDDLSRLPEGLCPTEGDLSPAEYGQLGDAPDLTLLGALTLPQNAGDEVISRAARHALTLQTPVIPQLNDSALTLTRRTLQVRLMLRAHLSLNAAQGRRWREHRQLSALSVNLLGSELLRALSHETNLHLSPAQTARLTHSLQRATDLNLTETPQRNLITPLTLHPDSDLLTWMNRAGSFDLWPRLKPLKPIPLSDGSPAMQAAQLVLTCAGRFLTEQARDPRARVPLPHQRNLIQMEAASPFPRGQLSAACADLTAQLCRLQWHHQSVPVSAAVTGALINLTGPNHPLWPSVWQLVTHLITRKDGMHRLILNTEERARLLGSGTCSPEAPTPTATWPQREIIPRQERS